MLLGVRPQNARQARRHQEHASLHGPRLRPNFCLSRQVGGFGRVLHPTQGSIRHGVLRVGPVNQVQSLIVSWTCKQFLQRLRFGSLSAGGQTQWLLLGVPAEPGPHSFRPGLPQKSGCRSAVCDALDRSLVASTATRGERFPLCCDVKVLPASR
jgi:hypothetical protein